MCNSFLLPCISRKWCFLIYFFGLFSNFPLSLSPHYCHQMSHCVADVWRVLHVWVSCVTLWGNPGDVQDSGRADWQLQPLPDREESNLSSAFHPSFPISPPIVLVNHLIDRAILLIRFQPSTPLIFHFNYCTISALTSNPCGFPKKNMWHGCNI